MSITNTRHLKAGDAEPDFNKKNLQLLSMRFCPYAHRVHLVLDAKKIPYDTYFIHLFEKPEWLTKYSPFGKVPALGLTDQKDTPWIYESLLVSEYIDEKYSENPLYPKDPLAKIQDRLWIQRFDEVIKLFFKVIIDGLEKAPGSLTELAEKFDSFEKELNQRRTVFFGGKKPGMVDYMIWPWCERFDTFKYLIGDKYELDSKRYPKMIQWKEDMTKDEAVQVFYLSGEVHAKYITSRVAGKPDYDFLLISNAKL